MIEINGKLYAKGIHEIGGEIIQVIDANTYRTVKRTTPISQSKPQPIPQDGGININTADEETLTLLDGVGKAGAKRIIAHRPYAAVSELTRVGGIGQKIIDKNADVIVL